MAVVPMTGQVVTIVGGGWSVANVAIDRLAGVVIAVNDAAVHLPRWDIAVSMDRLWTENRWDKLVELAQEGGGRRVYLRRSAVQNIPEAELERLRPWLHIFDCDHTTSNPTGLPGRLNGTNSGACALNVAWTMRPRRLFLLGFDMNRSPDGRAYWYPPYPWSTTAGGTSSGKYAVWAQQFEAVARDFEDIGCEVFNVSPRSSIETFRKIRPAQYLKEAAR